MILTVTLNPSIDSIYLTDNFELGKSNRLPNPHKNIGGKGINVSRVLAELGSKVHMTGYIGCSDFNREDAFLMELENENIGIYDFLTTSGSIRNAITIMHNGNKHTEIIEEGILLTEADIEIMLERIVFLCETYKEISIVNISGSANTKDSAFLTMLKELNKKIPHIKVLWDVSGKKLFNMLNSSEKIFFIKPNEHEISEILKLEKKDKKTILENINNSLFDNVENMLVSFGGEGALFKDKDGVFDIEIPNVDIVNTTGSGDSTVAGFTFGLENNYSLEECLKLAMACGISNAKNVGTGMITYDNLENLKKQIKITKIKRP